MKLSEALTGLGRPVAYFPELARFFGSISAAILFGQLFYWTDKAMHDFTFKKSAELEEETGLSSREQQTKTRRHRRRTCSPPARQAAVSAKSGAVAGEGGG